jgi:hypothetical protein
MYLICDEPRAGKHSMCMHEIHAQCDEKETWNVPSIEPRLLVWYLNLVT